MPDCPQYCGPVPLIERVTCAPMRRKNIPPPANASYKADALHVCPSQSLPQDHRRAVPSCRTSWLRYFYIPDKWKIIRMNFVSEA